MNIAFKSFIRSGWIFLSIWLSLFLYNPSYGVDVYVWDEQRNIISWRAELDNQASFWMWSLGSGLNYSPFNFGSWSDDVVLVWSYTINAAFGSVLVNLVDMVDISNLNHTWDISNASARLESSQTMQDTAPKPASLYTTNAPYWYHRNQYTNWSSPANITRNAVLFEFSWDIWWFGGWFGDLETRTDGLGTPAEYRLIDKSGSYVTWWVIDTSTIDQSLCWDPVNWNYVWCGNRTSRFIWWDRNTSDYIRYLLVIVWDDDINAWENDWHLERLSFIWWVFSESYYCGDGIIQTPNTDDIMEQCDDWNTNNSDGCSDTCQIESISTWEVPICALNVSSEHSYLDISIDWNISSGVSAISLDLWDGNTISDPMIWLDYSYATSGDYIITLYIQNSLLITWSCTANINMSSPVCMPSIEICDTLDNDCDGDIDEWLVCWGGWGSSSSSSSSSSNWWWFAWGVNNLRRYRKKPHNVSPLTWDTTIWNIFDIELSDVEEEFILPVISPKTGADIQ